MRESRENPSAWGPSAASAGPRAHGRAVTDDDDRLIFGVQSGDRDALGDLYDLHAPAMLGLAIRILRDRGDAEDLVHDVFIEAWHKASTFSRQRGKLRSWLLLRVRSRAIDRLRSLNVARRHAYTERKANDEAPPAVPAESNAPDHRRARSALEDLPTAQRTVVELAYFEGLSCSEIAARCDTPLGTVKSRLVSGMRNLRQAFDAGEGRDATR